MDAVLAHSIPPETNRYDYTVEEARAKTSLGRNTFYAAVKAGEIPSVRIGKRILIPRRPFDRLFGLEAM